MHEPLNGTVGEPEPIDRLTRPLRVFAAHRLSGAAMLLAATATALILANSRWADDYHAVLATPLSIGIDSFELSKPLLLWINDGADGDLLLRDRPRDQA